MQMDPATLSAYGDAERAIIVGRPAWATGGFALAVFGGVLGCLLLMLREPAASYLFIASLFGVIVTMIHTLGLGLNLDLGKTVLIVLMPLAVPAFLIWYSKRAQTKGWIA